MKILSAIPLLMIVSVGCVSTSNQPVQEIATARASITLADQNDAQRYATKDLNRAQQKLQRATLAAQNRDYDVAKRLAIEAEVDARVAASKATLMKSEKAKSEVEQTLNTLESELNRAD